MSKVLGAHLAEGDGHVLGGVVVVDVPVAFAVDLRRRPGQPTQPSSTQGRSCCGPYRH